MLDTHETVAPVTIEGLAKTYHTVSQWVLDNRATDDYLAGFSHALRAIHPDLYPAILKLSRELESA